MCDEDTFVFPRCCEHILIATPAKADISDVLNIVAIALQSLRNIDAHTLVDKKSRLASILQVQLAQFIGRWFVKFFPRHIDILQRLSTK